jgi:D-serine deaminase-like pyridoxal phosphate-dependent protein
LTLVATVLSRPSDTRIVCDAGWKSLAVYPVAPRLRGELPVVSLAHSAEHLTITLHRPNVEPAIGDQLQFDVGYADATTFLHRSLHGSCSGQPDAQFEFVPAHWGQAHRGLPAPLATTGERKHGH